MGNWTYMQLPLGMIRGALGVIALLSAFMAGRALLGVRRGYFKMSRLYRWLVRLVLCLAGVSWRQPVDAVELTIWVLTAGLFAAGYWDASRPREQEDLTDRIFHG